MIYMAPFKSSNAYNLNYDNDYISCIFAIQWQGEGSKLGNKSKAWREEKRAKSSLQ